MKRSGLDVLKRMVVLVGPLKGRMILAVCMGTLGHLCATFIPVFAGYAFLRAAHYPSILTLPLLCTCMVAMAAVRAVLRYAEQGCNHDIAFRLLALIRDRVFKALRRLCPAKLEGRNKGDLISLITSDIELLEVFYAHTISPICIAVLFTIVMVVYIGHYSFPLGLMALFSYLGVGLALPLLTTGSSALSAIRFREKAGWLNAVVLENVRGREEILDFDFVQERRQKMHDVTNDLLETQYELRTAEGRTAGYLGVMIYLFDLLFIIGAAVLQSRGQISFGNALTTSLALISSFGPVSALVALGSSLQPVIAAGSRVLDLLEEEPQTKEITDGENIVFAGARADHVSFGYDEEILHDVSAELEEGKIIGLCGKSGSGKSTLLKLFMRFYDTDKGRILVSDTDVRKVNTASLRANEAMMDQDTVLFHDTIRNNILVIKPDASEEELYEACRKASLHDFILSLPQGYDTPVGELGSTLSDGEKQRIGLARAFLHDAPFILLDEPVSNLDVLNEAVILKSLKDASDGRTILLVSHRPSSLRIADSVIELSSGRIS